MGHDFDYDYFVIGGGSGGVRSARIAASLGAKVGIAEGRHWGGTCVNIGCVPKKLFAYASDYGPAFEDAKGFGWSADNITFNWKTLIENKDKEINRLNGIYQNLLDNAGADIFEENASFKDEHTLIIGNKEITADKILIATGGMPRKPEYEGAKHTLVSDDLFYLDTMPTHIVIEGAGYIAVEFAHIFHGLGTEVTIIYRKDKILNGFEEDIREFLATEMKKQGINFLFNTSITKVEKNDDGLKVLTGEKEIDCSHVLSAIGRVPNTQDLALENAKIETNNKGMVVINDQMQATHNHIYAVGDVTNHPNLTPVAIAYGHILAETLFGEKKRVSNFDLIPTAIFSNPPIGTVGFSEAMAKDKGHDVEIFTSDFKALRHTISGRDERTFMKLIVDKKTDKVLGVHMCGTDAPEIMQGMAIALQCGATKADFDQTIGIHPTSAEEFVTMK